MTERLHAHDEEIEGGPPRASGLQPKKYSYQGYAQILAVLI